MKFILIFLSSFLLFSSVEKSVVDYYADQLKVDRQKIEDAIIAVAREEGLVQGTRALATVSRDSFDTIIKDLTPRQQHGMYELMRRPDLLKSYSIPNLTDEEIRFVFRNYPQEIGDNAIVFHKEHLDVLIQLTLLNQYVKQEFGKVLFGYPPEAQEAMQFLVDFPQILELLTRETATNRKLRKTYQERPDLFVATVDSIATKISDEYNGSIDEWAESIKSNPEALKAFEEAAGVYESHQQAKQETHNQTMMAKNQQSYEVSGTQQQYFQQYGTHRDPKKGSNVHVSVWVGAGYGFGYGRPYWYGSPYMGGAGAVYGGAYYNPYHNPYWF